MAETEDPLLFLAEFSDGYSFRNLIDYLKGTNVQGNFCFSKSMIYYTQTNTSNTLMNCLCINTSDLTCYEYNSKLDTEVIGINLATLKLITKSITPKDGLILYRRQSDPHLFVQIANGSGLAIRETVNTILPIVIESTQYDPDDDNTETDVPNCTVASSLFSKSLSSLTAMKCNSVTVRGFPKGVILEGMISGGVLGKSEKFGKCDSVDYQPISKPTSLPRLIIRTPDEIRIKITAITAKSLAKLGSLQAQSKGVVKFYIEKEKPIKMMTRIGVYGVLWVYLRDSEPEVK